MSRRSKIVESFLERSGIDYFDDKDKALEHMKERSQVEDEPYELPKMIYRSNVEIREMFGCPTICFNDVENADSIVLYIHGGAYVNEIMLLHVKFCDNLAKKANACVYAPLYPLAPNHTYKETYEIVENMYRHLLTLDMPIAIMGDSSGGGFSAAFAEYLAANDLPQPDNLVLLSPWVDVSMSGDYDSVEFDPVPGVDGLRELGRAWAGDLDLTDYRVSPIYGDVSGLSKTTIFVGTHEQLYSDVSKFYEKLKGSGVEAELNIGEGMNHVYPVYPFVPESKEAFNHIVDVILGSH